MLHALGRAAKTCSACIPKIKGACFGKCSNEKIHANLKSFCTQNPNVDHLHDHPACEALASGLSCLACEFSGSNACMKNAQEKYPVLNISHVRGQPADIRPMHCKTKIAWQKHNAKMHPIVEILSNSVINEIERLSVPLTARHGFPNLLPFDDDGLSAAECEDQQLRRADGRIFEPWEENQCDDICLTRVRPTPARTDHFRSKGESSQLDADLMPHIREPLISMILIAQPGELSSIQTAKTAKKLFADSKIRLLSLPVPSNHEEDAAAIFDLSPAAAAKVIEGIQALPEIKPSEYAKRVLFRVRSLTEGLIAPAIIMKKACSSKNILRAEFCSGNPDEIIAAAERFAEETTTVKG